jgi:DNA mismatch repair ATPase MutS
MITTSTTTSTTSTSTSTTTNIIIINITTTTILWPLTLKQGVSLLLACTIIRGPAAAIAWCDVTTGSTHVTNCDTSALLSQLQIVGPKELLLVCDSDDRISSKGVSLSTLRQFLPSCHVRPVADSNDVRAEVVNGPASNPLPSPDSVHDVPVLVPLQLGRSLLSSLLPSAALSSFSEPLSITDEACSVLLAYLNHNLHLPVNPVTFRAPQPLQRSRFMHIDAHAARALELTRAQDLGGQIASGSNSSSNNSVLKQLDETVTAGGSRCLQAWLLRPLVDVDSIKKRQDAVECLVVRTALRRDVKDALEGMGDIQRCMQKLLLNRAAPSDVASLARSLYRALRLQSVLAAARQAPNCM